MDANRGPTDYKASSLREGSSLAVAADITNFTEKIICPDTSSRSSLAPYYPQWSSIIALLQDQGLLIRKVEGARGVWPR